MQTRYRFSWFGVVAAVTCVLLLGSPGLTTAQQRSHGSRPAIPTAGRWRQPHWDLVGDVGDNDAADEGAVVGDVRRDSPAAAAGFVESDGIVEFDGERVRSASQLTRLVRETPAGRLVGVTVMRDGRRVELEVTPEARAAVSRGAPAPGNFGAYVSRLVPEASRNFTFDYLSARARVRLGVNVQELSSQLADYFGVDDGVLVSSVDAESVAADAGLQAGDVITSVDGRVVEDSTDLGVV